MTRENEKRYGGGEGLARLGVPPNGQIYRLPAVFEVTGLSKATIYRLLERGEFPSRVRVESQADG